MANLAQTVNVIQALVLTEGEKMILTPTYYVFDMFKGHMDATHLALDIENDTYSQDDQSLPAYSANASINEDGEVLLTLCNLKPSDDLTITCDIADMAVSTVNGTILVADAIQAHNTFDSPNTVTPTDFSGATLNGNTLTINLPATSVVALSLS